jgi:hypothetical protein
VQLRSNRPIWRLLTEKNRVVTSQRRGVTINLVISDRMSSSVAILRPAPPMAGPARGRFLEVDISSSPATLLPLAEARLPMREGPALAPIRLVRRGHRRDREIGETIAGKSTLRRPDRQRSELDDHIGGTHPRPVSK